MKLFWGFRKKKIPLSICFTFNRQSKNDKENKSATFFRFVAIFSNFSVFCVSQNCSCTRFILFSFFLVTGLMLLLLFLLLSHLVTVICHRLFYFSKKFYRLFHIARSTPLYYFRPIWQMITKIINAHIRRQKESDGFRLVMKKIHNLFMRKYARPRLQFYKSH